MATGVLGATPFGGHAGPAVCVAFSPDGRALATGGQDGTIRLWEVTIGTQTTQLTGHSGWVRDVAWSPDGSRVASASGDGTARLWEAATGTETTQLTSHARGLNAVAWSPDGITVATASDDGTARLWDAATGAETSQLTGHTVGVWAVGWAPDGTIIATASDDGTARLWDAATGAETTQLAGHSGWVRDVAWSPDGTTLATASGDGTARLWDVATGTETTQLTGHTVAVWAVAWSPDGTTLATASGDGTARLWDAASGAETTQFTGHTDWVRDVAWSPDGTILATTSDDGTIRTWNPRSGAQVNRTEFEATRAPARPLAGVRSDIPSDVDLLAMGDDVATLAELIAATETRAPLAIALIGEWGAGKSSVMLQVESRVTELADKARNNPGLSAFAENVRQVRFNAWHYSDEHLWTGLVSHLFEGLARREYAQGPDESDDHSSPVEIKRIRDDIDRTHKQLASRRTAAERLSAELADASVVSDPQGIIEWLASPVFAVKVLLAAARQAALDIRSGLLAVLGWAVLGGGAYAAWRYLGTPVGSAITALAVLAAPTLAVLRKLRAAHNKLLTFVHERRASLVADHRQALQDIRELEDRLVLIDAAEGLARFLNEQAVGTVYGEYQGLLGQVRADLDQLSARLAAARRQWEQAGRFGPPPLERIVLYIDDLDRCPPRRVVEVLEAVHLMLALDLFVVVVAVDARWLIRSLEYHHRELFHRDEDYGETNRRRPKGKGRPANQDLPREADGKQRGGGDDTDVVTSIDYLDKIFQIPFALVPPNPDATAAYLRSLLTAPIRTPRPGKTPQPAATSTTERTGSADVTPASRDNDSAADKPTERHADRLADLDTHADRQRGPDRQGLLRPNASVGVEATVELRPQALQMSQAEVEFMARLGGLLPTPRAAKRLVNIYRLVRIGIPTPNLAGFVGDEASGPYQAVQVLLAILVGHPKFAVLLFAEIMTGSHDGDLSTVVPTIEARDEHARSIEVILAFIAAIRGEAPVAISLELARQWCPQLARFSFYLRDLVGGYVDVAAMPAATDADAGKTGRRNSPTTDSADGSAVVAQPVENAQNLDLPMR